MDIHAYIYVHMYKHICMFAPVLSLLDHCLIIHVPYLLDPLG